MNCLEVSAPSEVVSDGGHGHRLLWLLWLLCRGGQGQDGPRVCSRKGATMVAAMAGGRPRVGAESLVGPAMSCCRSWCAGLTKGLVVPELGVGWRGSGGGETVVLEGGNSIGQQPPPGKRAWGSALSLPGILGKRKSPEPPSQLS